MIKYASTVSCKKHHILGEVGIWVFVFGDLLGFLLFFITFACSRLDQLELFA